VRYERERPGELIHVDVKKLGRIPPGGGHRAIGRLGRTNSGLGYDFLHVAIDDHSRLAFVRVAADDRGPTCARFLVEAAAFFAEHGISIERVMTDNAFAYTRSAVFGGSSTRWACVIERSGSAGLRPTARSSGSPGPCSTNGPT
jgi:hypothetical protein